MATDGGEALLSPVSELRRREDAQQRAQAERVRAVRESAAKRALQTAADGARKRRALDAEDGQARYLHYERAAGRATRQLAFPVGEGEEASRPGVRSLFSRSTVRGW